MVIGAPVTAKVVPIGRAHGRKRDVRKRTLSAKRFSKRDLQLGQELYPDVEWVDRPKTRGECERGIRPCPFVSCKHHLYLDVQPNGSIVLNFPDLEPWELEHTCALDTADEGEVQLEAVGDRMNLTRQRVLQLEAIALEKIRQHPEGRELIEYLVHRPKRTGKTHLRVVGPRGPVEAA